MLFTKLGRGLAILALILGLFTIFLGVFVASMDDPVQRAAVTARYGIGSVGKQINSGLYTVVFGIALGVVTDISRSLTRLGTKLAEDRKPVQNT